MDAYEATKIVLQRIQSLDPENASKIMGLLLIQDHGEKEMIRLALGPEALVHSVIFKARNELILQSNSPSRRNSTTSASCRFFNGGNLPSPLSIPNHSSSFRTRDDLISPSASAVSYAAIASNGVVGNSFSAMNTSASPFHGSGDQADLVDEFDLPDQFSFLDDGAPILGPRNSEMFYSQQDLASSPSEVAQAIYAGGAAPDWGGSVNSLQHRRSCSVSDISLLSDDSNGGLGWKPCLYFARGYCKNGTSCRFLHGGGFGEGGLMGADNAAMVGSPTKFDMLEQCQELLRSKSARQQQRLAAASQLMASANFSYSSVAAADKCMNLLLQQQQLEVESPRGDFRINGGPIMVNPGSRQIYLTFPAESSFKEEDVSNYFSIYGPVQDVRIPYQQKRMFGFVTFLYSETVKIILAKGNPHFVCDSRVLVKPYKEKGKVPDKFRKFQQQQHAERGEFGGCGSPTGLESRDAYDFPLGAKMFYDAQEVLWRRKMEEEADLQQAIELQNRRLMGLQLLDLKRNNHHRTLSTGAIVSSPIHSITLSSARSSPEKSEDLIPKDAVLASVSEHGKGENDSGPPEKESDLPGSLEHNLPDNPFASPKAAGYTTAFANNAVEAEKAAPVPAPSSTNNDLTSSSLFPSATSLDIAPLKSCYFLPSFTPGHGTVGM